MFRWVIGDTHWFQKGRGRPEDADERICSQWAARVAPSDKILHLGDVAAPSPPGALDRLLASLPGQVTWIRGNWDTSRKVQMALTQAGWEERAPFSVLYRDWVIDFTHEPIPEVSPGVLNVHGHVHFPSEPPREMSRRHLNLSCFHTGWAPVGLAEVIDARLDELERTAAQGLK